MVDCMTVAMSCGLLVISFLAFTCLEVLQTINLLLLESDCRTPYDWVTEKRVVIFSMRQLCP